MPGGVKEQLRAGTHDQHGNHDQDELHPSEQRRRPD
jgi:hypothetical protein